MSTLLSVLLLACAAPTPASKDRFFALGARPAATPSGASSHQAANLSVKDLSARGFLGGRQIVFRTDQAPLEVQRYPQLLWEEPPGRALVAELIAALRAGGPFRLVLGAEQRARADYLLAGDIARFEHLPTATRPGVAVDFTLTLMRTDDRRALMNRRYRGEEPTHGPTPEAMVQAFNRLSARLIGEAVSDLRRAKL